MSQDAGESTETFRYKMMTQKANILERMCHYHTSWTVNEIILTLIYFNFVPIIPNKHKISGGYIFPHNLVGNLFPAIKNLIWTFFRPHGPEGPLPEPKDYNATHPFALVSLSTHYIFKTKELSNDFLSE